MECLHKEKEKYDFTLLSLWSHRVKINPLYHYVRSSLGELCSATIAKKLKEIDSSIDVNNEETALMRYQVKYPCAPGLLVLAAVLEKKYKVRVLCLDVEREKINTSDWLDVVIKEIKNNTRCGVMVSFVTTELNQLKEFSHKLAQGEKKIKLIVGGVHATYNDEEILRIQGVDYVIRGEGEKTVIELAEALIEKKRTLDTIDGISYLDNNLLWRTPERKFMDLKKSPIPAYHCVEAFINKIVITTTYSRGCPYQCAYCAESKYWTSHVRFKDAKKFVDELELLNKVYNQKFIHIADSTFGTNRMALEMLCDELEKRSLKCFFSINIRPNVLDYMGEEMLLRLKKLNFVEMYMGIESADNEVVNSLNRRQKKQDVINTLKQLKKIGIPFIKLYLMLGTPLDNRGSFDATVKFVEDLLYDDLIVYATGKFFVPSLGTPLYNLVQERGVIEDSVRLDRYNFPPIYVNQNLISEEMDIYFMLVQIVQYKFYLNKCPDVTKREYIKRLNDFVKENYIEGLYY